MHDPLSINLIKSRKPHFLDRFITWALTAGRLMVIITETIALSAFLFRFGLDREIVDLNDKIKQDVNIVKFLHKEETKFRNLQQRISLAKSVLASEQKTIHTYENIFTLIPENAVLESFTFSQNTLSLELQTRFITSIDSFIQKLKVHPLITEVSITSIENKTITGEFIIKVTAAMKKESTNNL